MKIFGLTTRKTELASKSLDFITDSTAQVSANLANVSTPQYKAVGSEEFEQTLARALGTDKNGGLAKTNPHHLPLPELNLIKQAVTVQETGDRIDGNTVDLDKESVKLAQNNIKFSVYSVIASNDLGTLKMAVTLSAQ